MWVGVGRLVLDFYGNGDARLKNRNIESLCRDLRKKYNISILEIEAFDEPERCVIGFSVVMASDWKEVRCKELVQSVRRAVDETAFARVVLDEWDVLSPLE